MNDSQEIALKKGMALLDAKSFKIKIQYPSNWYWAYVSNGYSFSDKPVEGENVLLHLTKNPSTLPEAMSDIGKLGLWPASQGEWAEAMSTCVQVNDDKFCLSGSPEREDLAKQMLETLSLSQ